jgi:hypothetical protein
MVFFKVWSVSNIPWHLKFDLPNITLFITSLNKNRKYFYGKNLNLLICSGKKEKEKQKSGLFYLKQTAFLTENSN